MKLKTDGWVYCQKPIGLSRTSKIKIQNRVKTLRENPEKYRHEIQSDIGQILGEMGIQKSLLSTTKHTRWKKHHTLLVIELQSLLNQYTRILDTLK